MAKDRGGSTGLFLLAFAFGAVTGAALLRLLAPASESRSLGREEQLSSGPEGDPFVPKRPRPKPAAADVRPEPVPEIQLGE